MFFQLAATVAVGCLIQLPDLALKDNVIINGAHFYPEVVKIINVARETAPPLEDNTVWVTSAADGKHIKGSLHYQNKAIDLRISNVCPPMWVEARLWAERLQSKLGSDYDVILSIDHIHIELDPKGN